MPILRRPLVELPIDSYLPTSPFKSNPLKRPLGSSSALPSPSKRRVLDTPAPSEALLLSPSRELSKLSKILAFGSSSPPLQPALKLPKDSRLAEATRSAKAKAKSLPSGSTRKAGRSTAAPPEDDNDNPFLDHSPVKANSSLQQFDSATPDTLPDSVLHYPGFDVLRDRLAARPSSGTSTQVKASSSTTTGHAIKDDSKENFAPRLHGLAKAQIKVALPEKEASSLKGERAHPKKRPKIGTNDPPFDEF